MTGIEEREMLEKSYRIGLDSDMGETNDDPRRKLRDAIQEYYSSLPGLSDGEPKPTKATIPRCIAWDFCFLGPKKLGKLGDELQSEGPEALNGKKIYGLVITVASVKDKVDEIQVS